MERVKAYFTNCSGGVTINLALSQRRRLGSEARAVLRLRSVPDTLPAAEPRDHEIWRVVAGLPKQQRAVVALHYLEDRPLED